MRFYQHVRTPDILGLGERATHPRSSQPESGAATARPLQATAANVTCDACFQRLRRPAPLLCEVGRPPTSHANHQRSARCRNKPEALSRLPAHFAVGRNAAFNPRRRRQSDSTSARNLSEVSRCLQPLDQVPWVRVVAGPLGPWGSDATVFLDPDDVCFFIAAQLSG